MGGLSTDVTEEEFSRHFSKYGVVRDCVIMVDRATNRSRGFGFITFDSESSVFDAIRASHEIHGTLHCFPLLTRE